MTELQTIHAAIRRCESELADLRQQLLAQLRTRYNAGETLQQLADELGVTRQRIQQLLSRQ